MIDTEVLNPGSKAFVQPKMSPPFLEQKEQTVVSKPVIFAKVSVYGTAYRAISKQPAFGIVTGQTSKTKFLTPNFVKNEWEILGTFVRNNNFSCYSSILYSVHFTTPRISIESLQNLWTLFHAYHSHQISEPLMRCLVS